MVKLVDTRDLKSLGSNAVPVRVRLRAPFFCLEIRRLCGSSTSSALPHLFPRHTGKVLGKGWAINVLLLTRKMKHLTLVILLALAPLSWGEDVYYCVEEHSSDLEPTDSGDAYELNRYKLEKWTLKYEPDSNRLAIKGHSWAGDELYFLDCDRCSSITKMFHARDEYGKFMMMDGRFHYAAAYFSRVVLKSGTCTKF